MPHASTPGASEEAIVSRERATVREKRRRWTQGCRLAPAGHPLASRPGRAANYHACSGSGLTSWHSQERLPSSFI